MKNFLAVMLIACSGVAAAQRYTCEVDMIDIRTQRIIQTFSIPGVGDCFEAKKACAKERRLSGRLNTADCLEYGENNRRPIPGPVNPGPVNPGPVNPGPIRNDAYRYLNQGETVILNSKYVTVVGVAFNGSVSVRSTDGWNTISTNIRRESLSVINGCNLDLCTSDSVISVSSAKYVKVVGLSTDDRFVVQSTDGWNTLSSNIARENLAQTEGCLQLRFGRVCTGDQVINTYNRYMTVVGVQTNGRVVLRSTDGWNTLSTNVDPINLTVTR